MRIVWLCVALIVTISLGWYATNSTREPALTFENVVAHPIAGAPNSLLITLDIRNTGGPDSLIDARSDVAELALLKSKDVSGLPIPGDATSALTAFGGHVVLMGLPTGFGEAIGLPVILSFESSGDVPLIARIPKGPPRVIGAVHLAIDEVPAMNISAERDTTGWEFAVDVKSNGRLGAAATSGGWRVKLFIGGSMVGETRNGKLRTARLPAGRHIVEAMLFTAEGRPVWRGEAPVVVAREVFEQRPALSLIASTPVSRD